jgi:hypothetical protein
MALGGSLNITAALLLGASTIVLADEYALHSTFCEEGFSCDKHSFCNFDYNTEGGCEDCPQDCMIEGE